jgi:hypothetical protein
MASKDLTPKQEKFCNLFVSREFFGNGVESYSEAYNIDLSIPGKYASARAMASKLLTNVNILKRIDKDLDDAGLNDNFVDKQLLFTITQCADMGSKIRAINEYNKLRSRLTDKLQIETKDTTHITKWST